MGNINIGCQLFSITGTRQRLRKYPVYISNPLKISLFPSSAININLLIIITRLYKRTIKRTVDNVYLVELLLD